MLDLDVGVEQFDAFLIRADLDIGCGHIAQERHEHIVVVGQRGPQLRVGRVDCAAETAPQVQFPGQAESQIPAVGESQGIASGIGGRVSHRGAPQKTARGGLLLREDIPLGDGQLGARLEDAVAGLFEREVLSCGGGNQTVEGRIVEERPPQAGVLFILMNAQVGRVDPVFFDGGRGRAVVGADLVAVAEVIADARAADQRAQQ